MNENALILIVLGGMMIASAGLIHFLRWRKKKVYEKAAADRRIERILGEISKRQKEEEEIWRAPGV